MPRGYVQITQDSVKFERMLKIVAASVVASISFIRFLLQTLVSKIILIPSRYSLLLISWISSGFIELLLFVS